MRRLLTKSGIRYLFRHPWQFFLSVLGIALGVAIVVSIDIANHSSSAAFEVSLSSVAGNATHQIVGSSESIPDSVYRYLRVEKGLTKIAPLIEDYAYTVDSLKLTYRLLGVDVFAEKPFRDYLSGIKDSVSGSFADFLTKKNSIVTAKETADLLGKDIGDSIKVICEGREAYLIITGLIKTKTKRSYTDILFITDISNAQELTGRTGTIDFIDVIASPEEAEVIRKMLPPGLTMQRSGARSTIAEQMLDAFNINLTALSLLALIVGIFLIYNTMTFSVVRRKTLMGMLRAIGVTSNELFVLIITEAFVVGVIGTVLGLVIGVFIAQGLIQMVATTINDLYFTLAVTDFYLTPSIIIKAVILGIAATVLSAYFPAREAANTLPRVAMIRSEQESKIVSKINFLSLLGIVFEIIGAVILLLPSKNVWLSYIGILPVIIGFTLLTPAAMKYSSYLFIPLSKKIFGYTGKIASGSITQNMSRTFTVIASLSIAVAATIGVGTMIESFRNTVITWLENGLRADLYVSPPGFVSRAENTVLNDSILAKIKSLQMDEGITYIRQIELFQNEDNIQVVAANIDARKLSDYKFREELDNIWDRYKRGEIIVSEPFAYRYDLSPGSVFRLRTDSGEKDFIVAGVYYDYSSDRGQITIDHDTFKTNWNVQGISAIGIHLKNNITTEEGKNRIMSITAGQQMLIRSHKGILEDSITVFDRTFAIANVLQLLSVIVAFIGILSALMSLQLERRRELGIMRATGFLPSQVFKMVTIQTAIIGIISGILAVPLGKLLAVILVFIINRRSFGWTMDFEISIPIIIEALILSVGASLLAGIYPGIKMAKTPPAAALREE